MKGKRKILAIWIILLLITVPLGIVEASETNAIKENNEKIPIEIATLDSDEIVNTKTIYISQEELAEIQNTISVLIDRIESAQSWQEIKTIINNILGGNKLGIFSIIKTLFSKIFAFRTYVISSGHSYKVNPIKKGSIKIRKKLILWHYTSGELLKDRTIILKPLALKFRVLKGSQVGMISRFTGMFFYVARKIPQKSYTFFIGFAKRANGLQIPNGN
ncbi:MAG: hypothetical protein AYK22_07650 [Thermoplasmatales archaeon SG8-52-3]|nr:MAG: hypothetical protein AYK22_07650 [Thermoplasmatales archaeon SG8-52-3]